MKKYYEPELMDDFSIRDSRIDDALKELKIINNYLGGVSTTVSALKYFTRDKLISLKIIDVGSGSSDNLIIAKNTYPNLQLLSVDKNISVLNYSKNSGVKPSLISSNSGSVSNLLNTLIFWQTAYDLKISR